MLLNYTYDKAIEVLTLWLFKTLLCPMRKETLQQLWLRMDPMEVIFTFNPQRVGQNFTLVLRGLPVVAIAQETGIERKRVLRALTYVRMAFQKDIPEVFSGTVEVDETYLGGQWKNKRHSAKSGGTKRGRGTSKTPVFGILCRGGKVWAQVVPDVEAKTLMPLISRRVKAGSIVCSDTWKSYTGVAAKSYVYRLVKHHKGEYSDGKGNHINGLEGFWGYLKRRLAAKGGIRKERLPLYLAEYVWRYNHRNDNIENQKKLIMKQLEGLYI